MNACDIVVEPSLGADFLRWIRCSYQAVGKMQNPMGNGQLAKFAGHEGGKHKETR